MGFEMYPAACIAMPALNSNQAYGFIVITFAMKSCRFHSTTAACQPLPRLLSFHFVNKFDNDKSEMRSYRLIPDLSSPPGAIPEMPAARSHLTHLDSIGLPYPVIVLG